MLLGVRVKRLPIALSLVQGGRLRRRLTPASAPQQRMYCPQSAKTLDHFHFKHHETSFDLCRKNHLHIVGLPREGCLELGFNKNGFYCTEGPTDVAPSCFGHSAPKSSAGASPATATSLKKVDPSEP
jgi:hypothetical protein